MKKTEFKLFDYNFYESLLSSNEPIYPLSIFDRPCEYTSSELVNFIFDLSSIEEVRNLIVKRNKEIDFFMYYYDRINEHNIKLAEENMKYIKEKFPELLL